METLKPLWSPLETEFLGCFYPGKPVDHQLRCTSPDDSPLSFELVEGFLPEGVSLGQDGRLSGTPISGDETQQVKYYTFIVRAKNKSGNTDLFLKMILIDSEETAAGLNTGMDSIVLAKICDSGSDWPDSDPDDKDGKSGGADCCFTADTLISTNSGLKPISQFKPGDLVQQSDGIGQVKFVLVVKLGRRKLYKINDMNFEFTDEHPLQGVDGHIYAVNEKSLPKFASKHNKKLKLDTELMGASGRIKVQKLENRASEPGQNLYHLIVDGDGSYFAGGVLTHRKHSLEVFSSANNILASRRVL